MVIVDRIGLLDETDWGGGMTVYGADETDSGGGITVYGALEAVDTGGGITLYGALVMVVTGQEVVDVMTVVVLDPTGQLVTSGGHCLDC